MTNITEDYVSFETAKLLKEKGFDWEVHRSYLVNDNCFAPADVKDLPYRKDAIRIPTLQMAMKWLREVHKIVINIGWGEVFEENYQWWCIILNQNSGEILRENKYHKTYEEACEAAIKYCLENLI